MKLYHGTKKDINDVVDFPKATKAENGLGFYLTDNKEIAVQYGRVIEYDVPSDWTCSLMRPIEVHGVSGVEYVLSQREADELVVIHATSTTIH
jgi:hypothetical protein